MIKNPYFNQTSSQVSETPITEKKVEFKQYEDTNAKEHTTVPGLTSIIIPAYFNSYPVFHYTGSCIGSIREHTDSNITPYEIILIQNGETGIGFTDKNAKDSHADKIIFNKENLGFAKAVNQGIRCANGEYIAIVNTDVMVFNHWLEDLQATLEIPTIALIQAYPMYGMPYGRAMESERLREEEIEQNPLFLDSFDDFRDFSCVLTTKELFNKVGLFNEEFFLYGEDLDLIRRIEKAGGIVKSTKRVRTFHIIGATSSSMQDTPEIMNESKEKLKKIWGE
jgi:GT2 family glycosyltransferase